MQVALGLIEGFYGTPWSWDDRHGAIEFLAPHGYQFYIYAPKSDVYLRERWQEDHPPETAERLGRLAEHCRRAGVRFGVGLSPFEVYRDFDRFARGALARKISFLNELGVDDFAVLFDDMKGDVPELAAVQADIVHWIAERSTAERVVMCPTYYTDDALLDRHFGERPPDYLEELGTRLDPTIDIFWTGPEVCSREYSPGHLERVARMIGRKPLLWDNYPVNDGKRMSQVLHLHAFTGRPASIASCVSAHGVNPALQPVLSRIPALTLAQSYRLGDRYDYARAFEAAAAMVAGPELGRMLVQDIHLLHESALDGLGTAAERLRRRYQEFDHPAAREIVAWLDGRYRWVPEVAAT